MFKDFNLQNVKTNITSIKLRVYLTKITEIVESELIT